MTNVERGPKRNGTVVSLPGAPNTGATYSQRFALTQQSRHCFV